MRKTGVIRKYFANRGFGFLAADEGVADLFSTSPIVSTTTRI
jgi:cold shock CspA family protein